ncbi:MAG: hypothetical protein NTZ05_11135, partial [Chloroflexi bacterium]|nr:hypothetical protein [Chloroflexota bacterium]
GTILLGSLWLRGLAAGQQPVSFEAGSIEVAFGGVPLGFVAQSGAVAVRRTKGLWLVQQPLRAAHGVGLGVQPAVAITDANGAIMTGDSSTVVTLAIRPGTGAAGATLSCAQTATGVTQATTVNGMATFSGCAINLSGADYQLTATAASADVAATATGKFNVTFAGDTDANCPVSVVDVSLVVTHYGKLATDSAWSDAALRAFRADLDGDGRVGVLDFSVVVSRFASEGTGCAPAGNPAMVLLSDGGVTPANVLVAAGQTVLFVNGGGALHTATGDVGLWNSGLVGAGQSFAYVFARPGVFSYHSTQAGDGALTGTVTVIGGATAPANPG